MDRKENELLDGEPDGVQEAPTKLADRECWKTSQLCAIVYLIMAHKYIKAVLRL